MPPRFQFLRPWVWKSQKSQLLSYGLWLEPAEEQDCQFQNATGAKCILLPQGKLRAGGSLCVGLEGKESSPRATGCSPPPEHPPKYNPSETKARLFKMSGA